MKRLAVFFLIPIFFIPRLSEALDWRVLHLQPLVPVTVRQFFPQIISYLSWFHCNDRRIDFDETNVDCGGSCGVCKKSLGTPCTTVSECMSGVCSNYCPSYDYAGPQCALLCTTNIDSDAENDPNVAGVLRNKNDRLIGKDTCLDETTINEISSDLKGRKIGKRVACGGHEKCQEDPNGARCVPHQPPVVVPPTDPELPVDVPPTDEDRALCLQSCNDFTNDGTGVSSSGTHCWNFLGQTHFSVCENTTSARYVVCGWQHGAEEVASVSIVPCAGGSECQITEGTCHNWNHSCDDSDHGANSSVLGIVSGQFPNGHWFGPQPDWCSDYENSVSEYVCRDGWPQFDTRIPCDGQHHCEAGACRAGPPLEPTCTDSDSDGDARHVLGNVSGRFYSGDNYREEDFCDNDGLLVEELCSQDHLQTSISIDCNDQGQGEICKAGICQPGDDQSECLDPDGENFENAGTVTGRTPEGRPFSNSDSCDSLNPTGVNEAICENGHPGQRWSSCPPNELCTNGACQPACPCHVDRPDPNRPGTTTDQHCVEHADICRDNTVLQYGCDNGEIAPTSSIDCAVQGLHCQDGECVH